MVSGVRHDGRDEAFEAAAGASYRRWMDKVSGMDLGLSDGIQERLAVACVERLLRQRRERFGTS